MGRRASQGCEHRSSWFRLASILAAVAMAAAACGGGYKAKAVSASSATTSSSVGDAPITVKAADVPKVGTVLVNGDGRTLYVLSSEKGGKITCTDDNGCTKVWPDTELPKGVTQGVAGSGVQASLLGSVKSASGDVYLTYATWPLYTFSGDPGPGTANGEGITTFGGTWTAITPAGAAVTAAGSHAAATTPPPTAAATPTTARPTPTTLAPATTRPSQPAPTSPPTTSAPTTSAPPSTTPVTQPCPYPPCY
jgi:predicted lipoprotein with Yx(FWY)xxD motif